MTVGRAKLVDQSLRPIRLLHDSLLVVLPYGSAQLVVVHLGLVLPFAPQLGHPHRILDLEHAALLVQPPDHGGVRAAGVHLLQELLEELPQVDGRRPVVVMVVVGGDYLGLAIGLALLGPNGTVVGQTGGQADHCLLAPLRQLLLARQPRRRELLLDQAPVAARLVVLASLRVERGRRLVQRVVGRRR